MYLFSLPCFISFIVFLIKKLVELRIFTQLDLSPLINNIIVGLLTGLVSSIIVSYYYKRKEIKKDSEIYFNNLSKHIRELVYQLHAFRMEYNRASYTESDFDQAYERIRALKGMAPFYSRSFDMLPSVHKFYPRYKELSRKLDEHLNEYYQCILVLSVYSRNYSNISPEEKERSVANTKQRKLRAAAQISAIHALYLIYYQEIKDYLGTGTIEQI